MPLFRTSAAMAAGMAIVVGLAGPATMAGAEARMKLTRLSLEQLPGWQHDNMADALKVLDRACAELVSSGTGFSRAALLSGKASDWHEPCRAVRSAVANGVDERTARALSASAPET